MQKTGCENSFSVIFPMAGKGERFGGTFKPFLELSKNKTFIEEAFHPFREHLKNLDRVLFVYLREQEEKYNVSARLTSLFKDINFDICLLNEETEGPAQTISKALEQKPLTGSVFVADCDTSLDIKPLLSFLLKNDVDCALPLWKLKQDELPKWSVASIVEEGRVTGISEKETPKSAGEFWGVIGCYFFKDAKHLYASHHKNISEIVADLIANRASVFGLKVTSATFFGDPERLEDFQNKHQQKPPTIFCDIDGTIIMHENSPSTSGIQLLEGALDKLLEWRNTGCQIVLVTARNKINEVYLKKELDRHKVPYDQLVVGATSGPRIIINDRKPHMLLNESALSFEVERDSGIKNISYSPSTARILAKMKGGSLAETFLIEENKKTKIRKVVHKTSSTHNGYVKLKKQYSSLLRFKHFIPDLIPDIYEENDNSFEYYFDMQYMDGYQMLSCAPEGLRKEALTDLLHILNQKVYQYKASLNSGSEWLQHHLAQKVYPTLRNMGFLESIDALKKVSKTHEHQLIPRVICPIHGDLTLQNILFKKEKDKTLLKLIDMDGAAYMDAIELDLGKTFQSLLARYEEWDSLSPMQILNFDLELDLNKATSYLEPWENILNEDRKNILYKVQFYTALHLFRMLPFRLKKNSEQCNFAHGLGLRLINNLT